MLRTACSYLPWVRAADLQIRQTQSRVGRKT